MSENQTNLTPEEQEAADKAAAEQEKELKKSRKQQNNASTRPDAPVGSEGPKKTFLADLVSELPEKDRQSIYDAMLSYVTNKMGRDELLYAIFSKTGTLLKENDLV